MCQSTANEATSKSTAMMLHCADNISNLCEAAMNVIFYMLLTKFLLEISLKLCFGFIKRKNFKIILLASSKKEDKRNIKFNAVFHAMCH